MVSLPLLKRNWVWKSSVCALFTLALLSLACHETGADEPGVALDQETGPRVVVSERWDTVFVAGGDSVNDTLFAGPHLMAIADSVLVVGDGMIDRLVALDRRTGRVEWTFGGRGAGPQEFRGISDIAVTAEGTIWVLDFGNGRIARLTPDGEFLGVKTLHHLAAPPAKILPLTDRAIAMSHGAPEPFMEIELDSFELRRAFPLAWPAPVPELANTRVALADGPGSTWISAFALGPGFTVWGIGEPASHPYRDLIPFAIRPSMELRRMRADSARNGAVSLEIVGEEIHMLFGGRPHRAAHPAEPTVWIDIYSLEGEYLRSYRLPFDTDGMATDGRTFYVTTTSDAGTPAVIALQPILGR